MRIRSLNNREDWNKFLMVNRGSFLQSWEWGMFQNSLSKKVWRFCIEKEGKILGETQIIKETFPFNLKSFLYIPYGPCFKEDLFVKARKRILNLILKESTRIAKEENSIFFKIEPISPWPKDFLGARGLKRIQPKKTLFLDLKKSEEEIFQNFHPKTRYNIRLSQRKGVKIIIATSKEQQATSKYFDNFYKLIQRTAKRDKFSPYEKEYYKNMFKNLSSALFLAEYRNKIIAANLLVFFGERATYLHGGADYKYRKVMAPHLLQWAQIQESKKKGYKEYDFWGINAKIWSGLTRFKKSFRGDEFEYPYGKDFIFQNLWYKFYRFIRGF